MPLPTSPVLPDGSRQLGKPNERRKFCFGIPRTEQLEFFGDAEYSRLFAATVRQLERLGGTGVVVDFEPFLKAARLLYEGPWVAERYAAIEDFVRTRPQSLHPVTLKIIAAGATASATDVYNAQYRLAKLQRETQDTWEKVDIMVTPTAGTIYSLGQEAAEPIKLN